MTTFPARDDLRKSILERFRAELDRRAMLDRMTPVERSAYFAHLDDQERYPAPDIQFSQEGCTRG